MRRKPTRALLLAGAMLLLPLLVTEAQAAAQAVAEDAPITGISSVMIMVKDQDEALQWYTEKLGFEKKSDEKTGDFRWLTVTPKGKETPEIVLQKAVKGQEDRVGKGTAWVFATDDCKKAYETLKARGVVFTRPPTQQFYGMQAVFKDLYGNQFFLVSYKAAQAGH
jgi:predicted enzyme related to lactoylglutathione lyase